MKLLSLALGLGFICAPAFGQPSPPTMPITLSPAEYQSLISALAARDPIISQLVQKQSEAQQDMQRRVSGMPQHVPPSPPGPAATDK